jgi:hypothetical protein
MATEQVTEAQDDLAERGLRYTKEQWREIVAQTEDFVRANPTKSLLYGVAAGFLLDRLPIFRLFGLFVRLILKAMKPAILVYGASRLYQLVKEEE